MANQEQASQQQQQMDIGRAIGLVMMTSPRLGLYFLEDIRGRIVAKQVLQALKQSGFDLSTPSGVVLEALLQSGAVAPTEALELYMQLQEAQKSVIMMQSALVDLEYRRALLENVRANTLATLQNMRGKRAELNAQLVNEYFMPKIERVRATLKEIDRQIALLSKDALERSKNAKAIAELEARRNAYVFADELLNRWRIASIEELNTLTEQGMPAPLILGTAIARANLKVQNAIKDWLEDQALMLPSVQDVQAGRIAGQELVNILSVEVSPEYGQLFRLLLSTSSAGVLPTGKTPIPSTQEQKDKTEAEGLSFGDYLMYAGYGLGGAVVTKKVLERAGTRLGWVPRLARRIGKRFVPDRIKILSEVMERIFGAKKAEPSSPKWLKSPPRIHPLFRGAIRGGGMLGLGLTAVESAIDAVAGENQQPQSLEDRWRT